MGDTDTVTGGTDQDEKDPADTVAGGEQQGESVGTEKEPGPAAGGTEPGETVAGGA